MIWTRFWRLDVQHEEPYQKISVKLNDIWTQRTGRYGQDRMWITWTTWCTTANPITDKKKGQDPVNPLPEITETVVLRPPEKQLKPTGKRSGTKVQPEKRSEKNCGGSCCHGTRYTILWHGYAPDSDHLFLKMNRFLQKNLSRKLFYLLGIKTYMCISMYYW